MSSGAARHRLPGRERTGVAGRQSPPPPLREREHSRDDRAHPRDRADPRTTMSKCARCGSRAFGDVWRRLENGSFWFESEVRHPVYIHLNVYDVIGVARRPRGIGALEDSRAARELLGAADPRAHVDQPVALDALELRQRTAQPKVGGVAPNIRRGGRRGTRSDPAAAPDGPLRCDRTSRSPPLAACVRAALCIVPRRMNA